MFKGTCGNCRWSIDTSFTFLLEPVPGTDGKLSRNGSSKWPWHRQCSEYTLSRIKKVVVKKGVRAGEDLSWFFAYFSGCSEFDVESLDVSQAKILGKMFWDCASIKDISPLAGWDVMIAKDLDSMFSRCSSLKDISPIQDWDIPGYADTSHMFEGCTLENVPSACPEEGAFTAWKKCLTDLDDMLAKLLIPADARRISKPFGQRKECRADKAVVLGFYSLEGFEMPDVTEAASYYSPSFIYRKGETAFVPDFEPDRFAPVRSAPGIYFYMLRDDASVY